MVDVVFLFFGFLFVAVPVALLACALVAICTHYFGRPHSRWRTASGVIEESSLQYDCEFEAYPAIRYKFFVNDQPYWGEKLSYSGKFDGKAIAETIVSKYSIGRRIRVEYNPEDPEGASELDTSELEPISRTRTVVQVVSVLIFLVVFLAAGILMLYWGFNPSPENSTAIDLF